MCVRGATGGDQSHRRMCVCGALCVCCVGVCVCVTQALQCVCIGGDARVWAGCVCVHRVGGAVDSVWRMDVVSSTAIGVDCDWMVDGRVALPAIDG